jgi:hypothetical protein
MKRARRRPQQPGGARFGKTRATAWLAWGMWLLTVVLVAATLVVQFSGPRFRGSRWTYLPAELADVVVVSVAVPAAWFGALITARQPRSRIGPLLLAFAFSWTMALFSWRSVDYAIDNRWALLLPGIQWVAWLGTWGWAPAITALLFLLLLFPDGHLVGRRWWPAAWAVAAWFMLTAMLWVLWPGSLVNLGPGYVVDEAWFRNPLGEPGLAAVDVRAAILPVLPALGAGLVLVSASSLVLRFRRARGAERQQLKWLAYAAALNAVILALLATGLEERLPLWIYVPAALSLWGLPVAIGIAILRYRLYDIDRLINRTLVYGLLSALLGGIYAGAVLLLGQLFGGVADQPPSWAVAGVTLAMVAVFQPARRRIQQAVDRRFNRRRHDAAKTIQAFATHLRHQVDLDTLSTELLAVVDQTMEPTHVSLWLRPPRHGSWGTPRREARPTTWAY